MTARRRVDCPVCDRDVALTAKTGVVGPHDDPRFARRCKAAGKLTGEDAVKADLERLAKLVERYPEQARELVISTDRKRRASTRKGGR